MENDYFGDHSAFVVPGINLEWDDLQASNYVLFMLICLTMFFEYFGSTLVFFNL